MGWGSESDFEKLFENNKKKPAQSKSLASGHGLQQRLDQLERWREEKEKKKKAAAAAKLKPFLVGVPSTSIGYVPPPPVPAIRVTRTLSAPPAPKQVPKSASSLKQKKHNARLLAGAARKGKQRQVPPRAPLPPLPPSAPYQPASLEEDCHQENR